MARWPETQGLAQAVKSMVRRALHSVARSAPYLQRSTLGLKSRTRLDQPGATYLLFTAGEYKSPRMQ